MRCVIVSVALPRLILSCLLMFAPLGCSVNDASVPVVNDGRVKPTEGHAKGEGRAESSPEAVRLDSKRVSEIAIALVSTKTGIPSSTLTADVTYSGEWWSVIVWLEPRRPEGSFVLKIAPQGDVLWESSNLKSRKH